MVKTAVERKEAAWKEVLGDRDKIPKETCMDVYKGEKRKVKRCIYQSKKRRRMNSLEVRLIKKKMGI